MNLKNRTVTPFCSLVAAALLGPVVTLAEPATTGVSWSQWRGPQRDGTVTASAWPRSLSPANLKELWRAEVAEGYGGPVLSEAYVFTVETRDGEQEIVRVKAKELRELSAEELREREGELNQELFNLRIQKATGQLGNTAILGKTKRDLARVKTVLKELEVSTGADE